MSEPLGATARRIFAHTIAAVDVQSAVRARISLNLTDLVLAGVPISLQALEGVLVIAMGKAAVSMYAAVEAALAGLPIKAVVVAPPETLPLMATGDAGTDVVYLPGDHPTPTEASLDAADRILQALSMVTPRTVVLFLISGGASAMVERPLAPDISLDDLRVFTRAIVGSGLSITAMNALRKHMSAVKGGRLAQAAAAAAMQCTLLVSDVPHASPDAVASGPSLPDSTTVADCRALFNSLQQTTQLPASVLRWFRSPGLAETPKPEDSAFARAHREVVLSSDSLAYAAVRAAEVEGLFAVVDNTCDEWEYREAALYLLHRAESLAREARRPVCLISVGEVGVTLNAQPGEGGRNQQFALWCARKAADLGIRATVLSAGSDGVDGHSTAAGAVCDESTVIRAAALGWSAEEALTAFNAAPLLQAVGDALHTGPTGNNLRDLRLILIEPSQQN